MKIVIIEGQFCHISLDTILLTRVLMELPTFQFIITYTLIDYSLPECLKADASIQP